MNTAVWVVSGGQQEQLSVSVTHSILGIAEAQPVFWHIHAHTMQVLLKVAACVLREEGQSC